MVTYWSLHSQEQFRHWGRITMAAISQTTFTKCISLNENFWILNKIWLRYVPWGPVYNIPTMAQIMAWQQPDDKPLSEPMMPRCVNSLLPIATIRYHGSGLALDSVMACHLVSAKPLQEPIMTYCPLDYYGQDSVKVWWKQKMSFKEVHFKRLSAKRQPVWSGLNVLTHCDLMMPYGSGSTLI